LKFIFEIVVGNRRKGKKNQYLNVGQSGQSVMAQSADILASVSVVERVATVGCGEA
jgi:hypothetical protein